MIGFHKGQYPIGAEKVSRRESWIAGGSIGTADMAVPVEIMHNQMSSTFKVKWLTKEAKVEMMN